MTPPNFTLFWLPQTFAICRLDASHPLPDWASSAAFLSITRTPEELSIVCPDEVVPQTVTAQRGWRVLQVKGPLDFNQVGVLAALACPLAAAGVSIFVLSTYDTDYLLVREQDLSRATAALTAAGHRVPNAGR